MWCNYRDRKIVLGLLEKETIVRNECAVNSPVQDGQNNALHRNFRSVYETIQEIKMDSNTKTELTMVLEPKIRDTRTRSDGRSVAEYDEEK